MKVFTNENNSQMFKILISAQLAGKQIEYEFVSVDDERFQCPRRLPVLVLSSGDHLFSSNSSATLLLPPSQATSKEVNKWLLWEATELLPSICFIGSKTDSSDKVNELLKTLDSVLSKKANLVGSEITAADVCVWSTVYPLYIDEQLKKHFLSTLENIVPWVKTLESSPSFNSVIKKFKLGKCALASTIAACWYPQIISEDLNSPTSEENELLPEKIKAAEDAWKLGLQGRPKLKPRATPVLPVEGEENVFITSALPYVNNVPHLGNIIGCVLSADVFARYCRLRNRNTLYIAGTDEYGTATEAKAMEEGLTPREICEKYYAIHTNIYEWFGIQFDHFGRTTCPQQIEVVQDMFTACQQNGFLLTETMDQFLCQKCDRFLADRFVEGVCPKCGYEDARGDQCDGCGHLINATELIKPRCKQCSTMPIIKQSSHLFLDLPKVEAELKAWVDSKSEGWTQNARVITKAWFKEGLKPRCITRDLQWGVPVPLEGFTDKVFYVWFDAPIGYMSMTKAYSPEGWLEWWVPKQSSTVKLYQFMAKDNVPFHSIMFPATLLASRRGYLMADHLMVTEYLNYEDGKFSKSRGVGVFGNQAQETGISADVFRFYLLYLRPESQDTSFSWFDLALKYNTDLLNNLGNFVNRALMFTEKFFASVIQPVVLTPTESRLLATIAAELTSYTKAMDRAKLRDGIRFILNISRHGNQYMQSNQPWVLVKGSAQDKERAGTVVSLCCHMVGLLAALLLPYMPQTSAIIQAQLNLPPENLLITEQFLPCLPPGHTIGKPAPLFNKIEETTVENLKKRFAGKQEVKGGKAGHQTRGDSVLSQLEEHYLAEEARVKALKASGDDKSSWQAEENALRSLKEKLDAAREKEKATSSLNESIPELEAAIAEQGEKVRKLKSSGVERSVWQPEVDRLLELKSKLPASQSAPKKLSKKKKSNH